MAFTCRCTLKIKSLCSMHTYDFNFHFRINELNFITFSSNKTSIMQIDVKPIDFSLLDEKYQLNEDSYLDECGVRNGWMSWLTQIL